MLDRFKTVHYEATEGLDAGADGGAETEAVEPAAAAAAAPDYSEAFASPQFSDAVGNAVLGVLGQLADSEGGEGGQEEEFDFYGADPGEVKQYLDQIVESRLGALTQRYEPAIQQMEVANWQEKIDRQVGELETVKQIGQLFPEDHPSEQGPGVLTERLATAFLPEMRQLYGDNDRAVEGALRAAADYALPIVKAAHSAGYAARSAELQRISGAPAPAVQQGGEAQILDEPQDEFAALERYAERRGLR